MEKREESIKLLSRFFHASIYLFVSLQVLHSPKK